MSVSQAGRDHKQSWRLQWQLLLIAYQKTLNQRGGVYVNDSRGISVPCIICSG